MSDVRIAKRYAKSLLELAIEKDILEVIYEDIQLFNRAVKSNRELFLVLKNPVIKHGRKWKILDQLFQSKLNPLTMSFFNIVCKKGRTFILSSIPMEFNNQYNQYMGIENATVITASKISDDLKKDFLKVLKQISSANKINLEEKTNPDIIGGFILKIGDRQIDDSISGRLQSIRNKLITKEYNWKI